MKNSWLTFDSICMAMGDAVALNLMFETKQDHQLFFEYWNKYLGDMASLINYHLSPTGWVLLFKTKSSEEIKAAYLKLRSQSKKAKKAHTLHDVSKMLSEHFRIFLSQYVRRSNAWHHRRGTKVLQRFSKYILNEFEDYNYFFEKIVKQLRSNPQPNTKYQADERQYDVNKLMMKDCIWKVGSRMYKGLEKRFQKRFGILILRPNSYVLRKFLPSTPTQPQNPPHP